MVRNNPVAVGVRAEMLNKNPSEVGIDLVQCVVRPVQSVTVRDSVSGESQSPARSYLPADQSLA